MTRLVNRRPQGLVRVLLAAAPFALLLLAYVLASEARLAANPDDKLLPSLATMADSMTRMAFEPSKRTGDYLLWSDIVLGITPFIIRDLQKRSLEIPREQIIKAQTLGASSWQLVLRVLLPQLLPRLIDAVRLSLGAAWLFLIAAEAVASTDGLGYRVFLVRRYLSMDVILP